jgi:hypothetical protein
MGGTFSRKIGLISCMVLALQGCSEEPTDEWLVGSWARATDSCESGAVELFEQTGLWRTEGFEGTWELTGRDLTINVTGVYDDDMTLQPSSDVYEDRILDFDQNRFTTEAKGDFPETIWKRCSFGGDEPVVTGTPEYIEGDRGKNDAYEIGIEEINFQPWDEMANSVKGLVDIDEYSSVDRVTGAYASLSQGGDPDLWDTVFIYDANSCGSAGCQLKVFHLRPQSSEWLEVLSVTTGIGNGEEMVSLGAEYNKGMRNIILENRIAWVWGGNKYNPK